MFLIISSPWFSGGRENLLADFLHDMLEKCEIAKMFVFPDSHVVFLSVEIKGGLCCFLPQKRYSGECEYTLVKSGTSTTIMRNLNDFDVLIRLPLLVNIVKKVIANNPKTVSKIISGDTLFGIPTNLKGSKNLFNSVRHNTRLFRIENTKRKTEYVNRSAIKKMM